MTDFQGKLQESSVHVNRMKPFFTYDDNQIEPPNNLEPMKNSLEYDNEKFKLVMAPCDNESFDNIFSQKLDKIATLPEP